MRLSKKMARQKALRDEVEAKPVEKVTVEVVIPKAEEEDKPAEERQASLGVHETVWAHDDDSDFPTSD